MEACKRKILGLTGYAGSGKDTAAQGLIDAGWTRVAFADAVREAVAALNPWASTIAFPDEDYLTQSRLSYMLANEGGWDGIKHQFEIRRLLQTMGTEVGRKFFGDDCWIQIAKRKIDAIQGNVVITDVRFPNEAAAIREWGGQIVRIDRPGVGPKNDHASERLAFEADDVLTNDQSIEAMQAILLFRCA